MANRVEVKRDGPWGDSADAAFTEVPDTIRSLFVCLEFSMKKHFVFLKKLSILFPNEILGAEINRILYISPNS